MEAQATYSTNGKADPADTLIRPEKGPLTTVSPELMQREVPSTKLHLELVEWFDQHWYNAYSRDTGELKATEASVTTQLGVIAKPHLVRWYGELGFREASRKMHEAADRGSRVHWAFETWLDYGAVIYMPPPNKRRPLSEQQFKELSEQHNGRIAILGHQEEMVQVERLVQFMATTHARATHSEILLYSPTLRAAGTADLILDIPAGSYMIAGSKPVKLPGGLYIADIKTGSESEDHALQISAYRYMFHEMTGRSIVGGLILYTDAMIKNGIEGFKAVYYDDAELATALTHFQHVATVWRDRNEGAGPKVREFPLVLSQKMASVA